MITDPVEKLSRLMEITNRHTEIISALVSSNVAIVESLLPLLPKDKNAKPLLKSTNALLEQTKNLNQELLQILADFGIK